jgi:hypothetical protein
MHDRPVGCGGVGRAESLIKGFGSYSEAFSIFYIKMGFPILALILSMNSTGISNSSFDLLPFKIRSEIEAKKSASWIKTLILES